MLRKEGKLNHVKHSDKNTTPEKEWQTKKKIGTKNMNNKQKTGKYGRY